MTPMSRRSTLGCWIEAMRLRTLPVSLAGVLFASGICVAMRSVCVAALVLCAVFAVLAQIASNFANEYYDYRDGLDRAGREGPRRGVTEGDISPRAMKLATYATLGMACAVGCVLVALYGSPWMYAAGVLIALGAMAYSAGPWPLSRHGLGEVAVVIFFGIVPVMLTCMVSGVAPSVTLLMAGIGVGCLGANVLIVNNYRDRDDDAAVGKRTTVVIFGRRAMATVYLLDGLIAVLAMAAAGSWAPAWTVAGWFGYVFCHFLLWQELRDHHGTALNKVLKSTSILMCGASIYLLLILAIWPEQ